MSNKLCVCWKIHANPHPTSELLPITDGALEFDPSRNGVTTLIVPGLHSILTTLPVPYKPMANQSPLSPSLLISRQGLLLPSVTIQPSLIPKSHKGLEKLDCPPEAGGFVPT